MDYITANFQPLWVQCVVVGLLIMAITAIVILAWVSFWEWRDKKALALIDYEADRVAANILLANQMVKNSLAAQAIHERSAEIRGLEEKLARLGEDAKGVDMMGKKLKKKRTK